MLKVLLIGSEVQQQRMHSAAKSIGRSYVYRVYTKVHTCRRLGRGTCIHNEYEKKVCFSSFDRRRCQGENCGKGTRNKRTTGGQRRENSFSAPEKDEDGKHYLSPRKVKKCQRKKKLSTDELKSTLEKLLKRFFFYKRETGETHVSVSGPNIFFFRGATAATGSDRADPIFSPS